MPSYSALFLSLLLGLAPVASVTACVDDNIEGCDNIYGEPVFRYRDGAFERRSYSLANGRLVDSYFHKGMCVAERMVVSVAPLSEAMKQREDALRFLTKYLADNHGFTSDQLKALLRFERTSPVSSETGTAKNGPLSAAGLFTTSESTGREFFTLVIRRDLGGDFLEQLIEFQDRSAKAKRLKEQSQGR